MVQAINFPAPDQAPPLLEGAHRADLWRRALDGPDVPVIAVPRPKDLARRNGFERDLIGFGLWYLPHAFRAPNAFQYAFAKELERMVLSGARVKFLKALAAPRGGGKSTIVVIAMLWAIFYHHINFGIILAANSEKAKERIDTIKDETLNNVRLFEDFPEICGHVRTFGGDARQAPPGYPWSGQLIRFANGVYVFVQGMDGAIAGFNKNFERPDFILVDDMETVDTVRSQAETEALWEKLHKDVLFLPAQGERSMIVYICTIKRHGCISDRLTSPKNPEWRGQRFRALVREPSARDYWEKYMDACRGRPLSELRSVAGEAPAVPDDAAVCTVLECTREDFEALTDANREALRFYVANRATMDEGAELLDAKNLPLAEIYKVRAMDGGEELFRCELQNDPPDDEGASDLRLDLAELDKRRAPQGRGLVPAWAKFLFASMDLGVHRFHWEVDAWSEDLRTSQVIDCGWFDTDVNRQGRLRLTDDRQVRQSLVEAAVAATLKEAHAELTGRSYPVSGGGVLAVHWIGVDIGGTAEGMAWRSIVLDHCRRRRHIWMPIVGMPWDEGHARKAEGRNWIVEEKDNPARRIDANADEYKLRVARALQVEPFVRGDPTPGARVFNANIPREYLEHQTAEIYVDRFTPERPVGRATKIGWNALSRKNHWFDTAWHQFLLAELYARSRGVRSASSERRPALPPGPNLPKPPQGMNRESF